MAPLSNYNLPNPDSSSPLVNPSHATLHQSTNAAIGDIDRRVAVFEDGAAQTVLDIEHARLAAHVVTVQGDIPESLLGCLLMPIIWNLTGRIVQYQAAMATLVNVSDGDYVIDIVNGVTLVDDEYDPQLHTSILKNGPLTIPAGQHTSECLDDPSFFVGAQSMDTYIAVVLLSRTSTATPGGDLVCQLNRLL